MAIENSITFGGVNSADYGIYISGEGVFNAPKRDVEMITIPGRNGEFALDQGRFENITVTYPAFNFEPNDYDTFAQNLSDFRNAICSQKGYQRLTDTFHPDEYRMAAYIDGLEIKPVKYNTASQFNITFDCKPQRFLTSGEEAVTMPGKNLIPYPYYYSSGSVSRGITFTVNDDGTIILNGTGDVSSQPFFQCTNKTQSPYLSAGTEYIMSQTTSTDKSFVIIYFFDSSGTAITIPCSITYDDGTIVNENRNNITLNYGGINHEWCKLSFTSADPVHIQTDVRLIANAGTVTDATVQPMIRLASETDPHYVRYNGIYNPTLFESHPMLEVTGYGSVGINDETVTVNNIVLGEIQISNVKQNESSSTSVYPNVGNLNAGDLIYQKETQGIRVKLSMSALLATISSLSIESVTNGTCSYHGSSSRDVYINVYPTIPTYAKDADQTTTTTVSLKIKLSNQSTFNCTYTVTTQYIGASNSIQITASRTTGWPPSTSMRYATECFVSPFYGDSTKTLLPTPMYIDLDIGEAYGEVNNEIISFNNIVSMPAKLPVLDVGINTIAYDNTVTDLKVVPRWWRV